MTIVRRPPPVAYKFTEDDRPTGYHCWGCAHHFVPAGTPQPIDHRAWAWVEFLCDDQDCLGNAIANRGKSRA